MFCAYLFEGFDRKKCLTKSLTHLCIIISARTNRKTVCPDEINHEHGDITDLFIENIGGGKVFHLGGLAGVP